MEKNIVTIDNKEKLKEILNNFQLQFPYDQLTRATKKDFLEKKEFPSVNFLKEKNEELGAGGQCLELCVLLKEKLKDNGIESKIIPTNKDFLLHQSRFDNHSSVLAFVDGKEYLMEVGTSNPRVVEIPKKIDEVNSEKYEVVTGKKSEIKVKNKGDGLLLVEIYGQFGEPFIFELYKKKEVEKNLYGEFLHKSLLKNQSMFIISLYTRDQIGLHCDGFLMMNNDNYTEKKENKLKDIVSNMKNGHLETYKELLFNGIKMYNNYNGINK